MGRLTAPPKDDLSLPAYRPYLLFDMNHDQYDDNYIRGILNTVKTIAMVGI